MYPQTDEVMRLYLKSVFYVILMSTIFLLAVKFDLVKRSIYGINKKHRKQGKLGSVPHNGSDDIKPRIIKNHSRKVGYMSGNQWHEVLPEEIDTFHNRLPGRHAKLQMKLDALSAKYNSTKNGEFADSKSEPDKDKPWSRVVHRNLQLRCGFNDGVYSCKEIDLDAEKEAKEKEEAKLKENEIVLSHQALVDPNTKNVVIYPDDQHYSSDRILEQLQFVPQSVFQRRATGRPITNKKIMVYGNTLRYYGLLKGNATMLEQKCNVPYCDFTADREDFHTADVVVYSSLYFSNVERPPGQVWMVYMLESPYVSWATFDPKGLGNTLFNWTATYRRDSTLVAPYEKFVRYNANISTLPLTKNYAEGKTKKVAWFVSNCHAINNRLDYAKELGKYIDVDIYGKCGTKKCPLTASKHCFELLDKDYKFYLSFENTNCRDYITEKFFLNGLQHDVIPVVMGAAPEDYVRAAPPHSFIHVDDFESPRELADYLTKLDRNDTLYNEYFRWKGTGQFLNTKFWCRLCALAHDVNQRGPSWYENIRTWWDNRKDNICVGHHSWRKFPPKERIAPLPVHS